MPATLPLPEVQGVEWLEPQTRDNLGPIANDRFGGTRTFSYVVRIHRAGAVDLGEIRLPYWDPQSRAYNVARTALGIVQVTAASGRDAGVEVAETILPGLPKARASLEGKRAQTFLTERPIYWAAVFGSPLLCALAIVLGGAVRHVRQRRENTAPSPDKIARARRAEAAAAMRGTDGKAALAATLRAVEAGVLSATGVNVRGTSGEGAASELVEAGVEESAARAVVDVIAACEAGRFSPTDVAIEDARAVWKRAEAALAAVRGGGTPPAGGDG
jgi:hypothetical protein